MTSARYADLAGRTVLVTGGASGIGAAHVRAFAANGARVAFLDIQDDAAAALVDEAARAGAHVRYLRCDLTDLAALGEAVARVHHDLGPIAALVNNAAVDDRQDFETVTPDDFTRMIDLNLRHVVFATQKVVPQMRALGFGSIVNTSSVAWMRGVGALELYSAAKAAIIGFTNSLARDYGRFRIRANVIAPGLVLTPRQQALWDAQGGAEHLLEAQCLPDPIRAEDVAEAALFLCSDASRAITKQCITVNAGSW